MKKPNADAIRRENAEHLTAMQVSPHVYQIPVEARYQFAEMTCLAPRTGRVPIPSCAIIGALRHERVETGWRCGCCGFVRPNPMHGVTPEKAALDAAVDLILAWNRSVLTEPEIVALVAERFHLPITDILTALVQYRTTAITSLPPAA